MKKQYKRRRFYFTNTNSYPERCSKENYEYWKKDFTNIKQYNPLKHINGWEEAVYNGFGAIIGYIV